MAEASLGQPVAGDSLCAILWPACLRFAGLGRAGNTICLAPYFFLTFDNEIKLQIFIFISRRLELINFF